MDVEDIEEKIDAVNALTPVLYRRIKNTYYEDTELKQRKLQVLKDIFVEIDYKSLSIPAENIETIEKAFDEPDFNYFRDMNIAELLCFRSSPTANIEADV